MHRFDVTHQVVLDWEGLGAGVALPAQVLCQRHFWMTAQEVAFQGALERRTEQHFSNTYLGI